MSEAIIALKHGNEFPFDASDAFWNDEIPKPEPSRDWSHAAARGVIANLKDRRGIKHGFDGIAEKDRIEIVDTLARIIRLAYASE